LNVKKSNLFEENNREERTDNLTSLFDFSEIE